VPSALYGLALAVSISVWFIAIRAPLWLDETISFFQIKGRFSEIMARQGWPAVPVYSFILWPWVRLVGSSEIALRIPSVLAMLGAVYLLYRAARQLFERDVALIANGEVAVVQPADELETKQVVAYAVERQGPIYLRLTRQNLEPVCPPGYRFEFGRWLVLRPGNDVTLIATGGTVFNALEAARRLEADGIAAEVINAACIKPLDEDLLLGSAGKTGHVVTVEDHSISGGLGGAVAETLGEVMPTPMKRLAVQGFGESGDAKSLYAKHGLDPVGIAASVRKFLDR